MGYEQLVRGALMTSIRFFFVRGKLGSRTRDYGYVGVVHDQASLMQ